LIMYPRSVEDGLDEATRERMQQHQEYLSFKITVRLEQLEQSSSGWGALGFSALQEWQFSAIAGVLLLLLGLCWRLWKRSRELKSRCNEESSSSKTVQEDKQELEEEPSEEDLAHERRLDRTFLEHVPWPVQKVVDGSREVEELVGELVRVFQELLRTSHLELVNRERKPERIFRVLVELECTCTREERREIMLCFLHRAKADLTRNHGPSFLDILCTDSCLDGHKTALWFQRFVRSNWGLVPQTRGYNMKVLPSSRSCKLQLTNASGRPLFVEMIFAVQQGDSDVFLTSQATEDTFTHGTIWPESYAVAEVKFFRLMARQVPQGSLHLKYLHLFACSLAGTDFDTYTFKTVVMHLLNTTAPSAWCSRHFLPRLEDIMWKLCLCLQERRLNHFFFGNESMPKEIILPPDFQTAQPLNLFEYLEQDPVAHNKAKEDLELVESRLLSVLFPRR
ncbi:PREDICTED: inositol 1,4,5-trisphosphate receptor-interacting protein-like 1, partial [Merops nubicus]|uniref:inositol 1,4,5-trisphosphate receptor-interacting protein-like 1 n=1 Tax=Merops nubicus TaxID=57421 RepID=UPI0004F061FE